MRQPRVLQGDGTEPYHGTESGYVHYRCGCTDCKRAHADQERRRAKLRTLRRKSEKPT